jgi:hypothetical protein
MISNPYQLAIPRHGRLRQAYDQLSPILSDHIDGFEEAMTGPRIPRDPEKRVHGNTMLRIAIAAAEQASHVVQTVMQRIDPFGTGEPVSLEANTPTQTSQITSFVTQMIHMSLDIFPRLLAPNFVSVQPFTQPAGYVFYLKRKARTDSSRDLADKDTFDASYGDLAADSGGTSRQLAAVGIELTKTLVEVKYKALMHEHPWESEVALRSQYGLDILSIGDMTTADELAWEVDREVISSLVTYAQGNPRGALYFDNTKGGAYDTLAPSEQKAWDRRFLENTMTVAEIDMAADVYRRPTWYLCGTNVAKLLARTPDAFADDLKNNMFDQAKQGGSLLQVGTLRTGPRIWFDPQLEADTCIAGHTDNMNPFYAGYIYCPFGMASLLTSAFLDPDNLFTKKARALAFAKVGVRSRQYREIKLGSTS